MPFTINPFTGTFDYNIGFPGSGIPVSTGSAWSTSKATPTGVIVGDTDTQTLSGKTLTSPVVAILKPASDSTTAVKVTKADGSTAVLTVDTTNSRLGIGATPGEALEVTGNAKLSTGSGLLLQPSSTSNGYKIFSPVGGAADAYGGFYPTAGTNTRLAIQFIPKGNPVGAGSYANAQFILFNSDFIADATNYEGVGFFAKSTTGYGLLSLNGGTGSLRPIILEATGAGAFTQLLLNTDGSIRMGHYGAGTATFDASGNISSASDERLKDVTGKFEAGLGEILEISPITYTWKSESGMETENEYAGFSAQNVATAIPMAVCENAQGYFSVSDRTIIAALVNAVKTLEAEVVELRKNAGLPIESRTVSAQGVMLRSKQNPTVEAIKL